MKVCAFIDKGGLLAQRVFTANFYSDRCCCRFENLVDSNGATRGNSCPDRSHSFPPGPILVGRDCFHEFHIINDVCTFPRCVLCRALWCGDFLGVLGFKL